MEDEERDEKLLFAGYRLLAEIQLGLEDAAEPGMLKEHRPDFAVLPGQREKVLDASHLGIRVDYPARVDEATNDAGALEEREPVIPKPVQ